MNYFDVSAANRTSLWRKSANVWSRHRSVQRQQDYPWHKVPRCISCFSKYHSNETILLFCLTRDLLKVMKNSFVNDKKRALEKRLSEGRQARNREVRVCFVLSPSSMVLLMWWLHRSNSREKRWWRSWTHCLRRTNGKKICAFQSDLTCASQPHLTCTCQSEKYECLHLLVVMSPHVQIFSCRLLIRACLNYG